MKMEFFFAVEAISEADDAYAHAMNLGIVISERIEFEPMPDDLVADIAAEVGGDLQQKVASFLKSVQRAMNSEETRRSLREAGL